MTAKPRIWFAWLMLLVFETICQVSLKKAGLAVGEFGFTPDDFHRAITTPWLWSAIGCYVGAFLSWITILRKSTLSAAFATSAIVFVAVMVSSWVIFAEKVGVLQIVGSCVILIGILMLGADEAATDAPQSVPPSTAHPGTR
jgi:drug/metabolite transporter (DMT)-like permease